MQNVLQCFNAVPLFLFPNFRELSFLENFCCKRDVKMSKGLPLLNPGRAQSSIYRNKSFTRVDTKTESPIPLSRAATSVQMQVQMRVNNPQRELQLQKRNNTPMNAPPRSESYSKTLESSTHIEQSPLITDPFAENADSHDGKKPTVSSTCSKSPSAIVDTFRNRPIFWTTLNLEGAIDPLHLTSMISKLHPAELQEFMWHMSLEMSLHAKLGGCKTIEAMEQEIMKQIPLRSAVIWVKGENAGFLISPTTKEVVPVDGSIVGYCLDHQRKIITNDPADHSGFSIDYDLTLLRGAASMAVFPIMSDFGDPIAVLQCVDLFDTTSKELVPITRYWGKLLKMTADVVKSSLFSDPDKKNFFLPNALGQVFSDYRTIASMELACETISKFLQKYIDCEGVDIYAFDQVSRTLTNLRDKNEYKDLASGGISFIAGMKNKPVFVPHGLSTKRDWAAIDTKFTNRSVLSKMFYYCHVCYVFTLRSKWQSPAFHPEDLRKLCEVSEALCGCLALSKRIEEKNTEAKTLKRMTDIMKTVCEAMDKFSVQGEDPWQIVTNAAKDFFDCDACFVCVYDGVAMRFLPSKVTCKFDDCIAGQAYNYREVMTYDDKKDDEKAKQLYESLGVAIRNSVAFPFSKNGKVAGALEIVNPTKEVDKDGQTALISLSSLMLSI